MIWFFAALLTAFVLIILLWPLFRALKVQGIAPQEVYKAQLAEVERETATGLMREEDAEAARAEIARRILRADAGDTGGETGRGAGGRGLAAVVGGLVGVAALVIYLTLGQPNLPGQPIAQRDIESESAEAFGPAAQELERRLAEIDNPADRAMLLGDAFASLGAIDDAESAYRNALGHRPDDPDILTRLGEVEVMRGEGLVTEAALDWVEQALAVAADHPAANFYRALYGYQQGDYAAAESRLSAMLIAAPPDASWTTQVTSLLTEVQLAAARNAAVSDLDDESRDAMIRGMVQQLAARLENDPDDFDGWLRLANSYAVLDEREAAQSALSRARALAQGEPVLEQRVQRVAESLLLN